ncbi:PAS domain-containing protein [Thermodesulfobium sp. 4217-1]|uniref:PAS domain-containing protein n=1 Tax=Thermodesulfobium sp. 4217-1 TaxID=3120013 RepID=UPI00322159DD
MKNVIALFDIQNISSPDIGSLLLNSVSDGIYAVDMDFKIIFFNKAAEHITGVSEKEAMGKKCYDVFRSNMCINNCPIRETLEKNECTKRHGYIIDSSGNKVFISVSNVLIKNLSNEIVSVAQVFRDQSEIMALREEILKVEEDFCFKSKNLMMQKSFSFLKSALPNTNKLYIIGEQGTGKSALFKWILKSKGIKNFAEFSLKTVKDLNLERIFSDFNAVHIMDMDYITKDFKEKLSNFLKKLGNLDENNKLIIFSSSEDCLPRDEFYFIINEFRFEIIPLRFRKEDIIFCAESFLFHFSKIYDKKISGFTQNAINALNSYDYPENIEELRNIIERAILMCSEEIIDVAHLPEYIQKDFNIKEGVNHKEKEIILNALKKNGFNRDLAAKDLGLTRSTFFRKLKKLEIVVPRSNRSIKD